MSQDDGYDDAIEAAKRWLDTYPNITIFHDKVQCN